MRIKLLVLLFPVLLAAACGSTHKTVVVTPPADSTTVIDQNGDAHVVKHDN